MKKSLTTAYICWLFGGFVGLHHFYLERDRQAFIYFSTLGGFFFGYLYDLYRMPEYVKEANNDPIYIRKMEKLQVQLKVPAFLAARFFSSLVFSSFFTFLIVNSIQIEKNEASLVYTLIQINAPFLSAIIVYYSGTEGPMLCSFRWPLLGAYIGFCIKCFYFGANFNNYDIFLYPIISTLFLNWNVSWDTNYKSSKENKGKIYKRAFKFMILTSLFMLLISVFCWYNLKINNQNGEKLTLRESVSAYLDSDKFKLIKEYLNTLWNFYKIYGFSKLVDHLWYENGDRYAISNAYLTIGLEETVSQKKLDQTCRILSRQWHPDRFVKNPEKKEEAEKKFMEIQSACNMLSEERKLKSKKNTKE